MTADIIKIAPHYKLLMQYLRGVEKEVFNRFGVKINLIIQELESPFTMDMITKLVSDTLGISINRIFDSSKGDMDTSAARHISIYLIKKYVPGIKLVEIARFFKRDHTTIMYAIETIDGLIAVKDSTAKKVMQCEKVLVMLNKNNNES